MGYALYNFAGRAKMYLLKAATRDAGLHPANYQARLKTDSSEKIDSFSILADPRINANADDYLQQQQTLAD